MTSQSTLRRFNCTYTQRIGVLDESFLRTGRPLAVNRLLFEIGSSPQPPTVRDLRARLGLDSGHLSRLIRHLETDALLTTAPDQSDRRRRVLTLTARGIEKYDDLDRRSDELAAQLLAPLTPRQRERLNAALATADLLMRAATVVLEEVQSDDPSARNATTHYFAELARRFPDGFDPGGPAPTDRDATSIVAISDGRPVAHGALRPLPDLGVGTCEIKRMWVDSDWRGAGLGARMLRCLESLARSRGYDRIVLDTNGTLGEAIAMYRRAGYQQIDRYNDNPYAELFFAKEVNLASPEPPDTPAQLGR